MKNEYNPFFSVIIPCYNVGETIAPTLKCLENQTFKDFELIFVNDGSIDGTQEILENFQLKQKINIIKQTNKGLGSARNVGISASSGKYIALLDADDKWENEKLTMVHDYLSIHNCDLLCHNEYVVNEKNELLKNNYYGPHTSFDDLFLKNNCLSPSAVTMKRGVIDIVGFFTENLKMHGVEDYDMWLRMALANVKIKYMSEFLGSYVIHGNNMSTQYDFFEKMEAIHLIHIQNINLNNYKKAFRYKIKMLKLYLSKLKAAVKNLKMSEIYLIQKDIFYLIFLFDQFIYIKTNR